jgi:hypothetical protein
MVLVTAQQIVSNHGTNCLGLLGIAVSKFGRLIEQQLFIWLQADLWLLNKAKFDYYCRKVSYPPLDCPLEFSARSHATRENLKFSSAICGTARVEVNLYFPRFYFF